LLIAQAALNAFLQATVTGPVLDGAAKVERSFLAIAAASATGEKALRRACLRALDVDGVSVYPFIPHVELFCLARWIVLSYPQDGDAVVVANDPASRSPAWLRVRVLSTHFKLLAQPSLGSGSVYVKAGGWSEVPGLQGEVERGLEGVDVEGDGWGAEERVQFLVEKANVWVMLGREGEAREAVERARGESGLVFRLSGALGRRTKFQERSTSLLVVLARSRGGSGGRGEGEKPETVRLVDDTLLEKLAFTGEKGEEKEGDLPEELKGMDPDDQPQLAPLDQIILLTEATLKDAFSPADELTSEEILPFAVRVISDRSTNWQIYTQALLVRSRIEVHRSRTIERGILQMQAVVDQVVVDTTVEPEEMGENGTTMDMPVIRINADPEEAKPVPEKPTSFFPAAKPTESAPAQVRLQYLHALSTPPRWHLESELAFSWASVGSLVSAVDIFKRLRLWAEVALCMASHAANSDEDGRGSGGEERAKALVRWRLFRRTGTTDEQPQAEDEDEDIDINEVKLADFQGPERSPPPHNAPRLFCILGDMENEPKFYERAWDISKHRFSRAQKSLGEYYLQQKDLPNAKAAYEKAISVNRMSSEMWSRLGDISLRMGDFSDAADAFGRAIACADSISGGDDARTWSNLGTALYSQYIERVKEVKQEKEQEKLPKPDDTQPLADDEEPSSTPVLSTTKKDPATLLSQSLAAFKRGASISHDNWRIWDNVITLAARLRPVAVTDILLALRNVIRIRSTEDCLDVEILRLLLNDAVLSQPKVDGGSGVYDPPRGSPERAVVEVLETLVAPLITVRSELWELVARERVWKRDYAGAVGAAERAWRAAVGAAAGGGLMPAVGGGGKGKRKNWLEDEGEWGVVVERTDELVSILENYGGEVPEIGGKWKGKARSAVRSVLGKAKESWEGSEGWERLKGVLEGLK
ncbi:hypothetical protein B0T18DRAFT_324714, partial [Schizothecium vesticola]